MKTVTIKEGRHSSHWLPRFWIRQTAWNATFVFTDSCRYSISYPDQDDWNKLFGVAFGIDPHENSARWAWRYNGLLDVIEICPYTYQNGTRIISEYAISRVSINRPVLLAIARDAQIPTLLHFIADGQNTEELYMSNSFWGVKLEPYFGGNQVAPHDIHILTNW
jgi:hypothetical protein